MPLVCVSLRNSMVSLRVCSTLFIYNLTVNMDKEIYCDHMSSSALTGDPGGTYLMPELTLREYLTLKRGN